MTIYFILYDLECRISFEELHIIQEVLSFKN